MLSTVLLLILFQIIQQSHGVNPIVETKVGTIRGVQSSDGDYNMFMGIPYADVDEKNPFGEPIPHPKFDHVFEADDDSAICPQREQYNNTLTGTLDCLRLNVYVPTSHVNSTEKLPVMVYIYGGQFTIGFYGRFLFGPKYLVRYDVILVTLSYRVGPYGFMCLDTPEVPGNQGLKDQLLALRWLKNNIESFGGDVDRITLFGNSAGGMSAEFHLLYSKEYENLFRSIIVQSGSVFNSQATTDSNATIPILISERLGFTTNNINEALAHLATVDTNSVIEASLSLGIEFRPCVEKQFPNVEAFITDHPINLEIAKAKGASVMTGFNSHEFLALVDLSSSQIRALDLFTNQLAGFHFNAEQFKEIEYLVRRFYMGDEEIDDSVWGLIDFVSDIGFNYPAERSIAKYMENGADKVFYYLFSYDGGRNYLKIKDNVTAPGASHADEYGYLFEMQFIPGVPMPEDQLMIDRMTTMWTNFAKYGDPTPQTSELIPVKWEPITNGSVYHYLNLDSELSAGKRPFHHRMAFWDLFYKTYGDYERGVFVSSATSVFPLLGFTLFFVILNISF